MIGRLFVCAVLGAALLYSGQVVAAQVGIASYYRSGKLTANGESFNPHGMTAAHKHLKFGTKVLVTDIRTGRSVIVRINDRGPFIAGRIIDLSLGAARALGIQGSGLAKVKLTTLN
jgi:rare lipoprotein A